MRFALLAVLVACSDRTDLAPDIPYDPDATVVVPNHRVQDAITALQAPAGTDWSLTFEDLQTGERVAVAGDAKHVSASSAKAWWVAAALDKTSISAVTPYATPIFQSSDNSAAGA